ncbi:MAG: pantetheine-phosphate adenylyltransferase [Clostridia bacterium]|nr:pantetheine-phosphate adenylyltransferase [Clostridia bacterium]
MKDNKKKCVFAGTFDPPTIGHEALIGDCLKLFDEVVVAIMVNPTKTPCFTVEERKEMLSLIFEKDNRIRITEFDGTVAELLEKEGTDVYVRGIRNGTDLDFENANFYASCKLNKNLTAVYLPCRQNLLHISSSMVRNSLKFGTPIDEYVSPKIKAYIQDKGKTDV